MPLRQVLTGKNLPLSQSLNFMWQPKEILASVALIVASVLAVWGMLLPPIGDVEQNLIILVAQFLVFAATLLGIGSTFERFLLRMQGKGNQK